MTKFHRIGVKVCHSQAEADHMQAYLRNMLTTRQSKGVTFWTEECTHPRLADKVALRWEVAATSVHIHLRELAMAYAMGWLHATREANNECEFHHFS